jgi:hypothetical protein
MDQQKPRREKDDEGAWVKNSHFDLIPSWTMEMCFEFLHFGNSFQVKNLPPHDNTAKKILKAVLERLQQIIGASRPTGSDANNQAIVNTLNLQKYLIELMCPQFARLPPIAYGNAHTLNSEVMALYNHTYGICNALQTQMVNINAAVATTSTVQSTQPVAPPQEKNKEKLTKPVSNINDSNTDTTVQVKSAPPGFNLLSINVDGKQNEREEPKEKEITTLPVNNALPVLMPNVTLERSISEMKRLKTGTPTNRKRNEAITQPSVEEQYTEFNPHQKIAPAFGAPPSLQDHFAMKPLSDSAKTTDNTSVNVGLTNAQSVCKDETSNPPLNSLGQQSEMSPLEKEMSALQRNKQHSDSESSQ